jgi:hypothetical protein
MKILLVGQAPNHTDRLCTQPPLYGSCRKKIMELTDISEEEFASLFATVNLINRWPGRLKSGRGDAFPLKRARKSAEKILREVEKNPHIWYGIIFVGRNVQHAFGVTTSDVLEWTYIHNTLIRAAVLPHTSGLNRWWNLSSNSCRAAQFLKRTISRIHQL